ncbi:MAG: hypothetical protein KDC53_06290 [Saprospiraceae bacterium]|nr:hypothetical protein [Saprospiraceae bacterium]
MQNIQVFNFISTPILILVLFLSSNKIFGQNLFLTEGNGLFTSASSTNIDIKNTDDNTNALMRFGDNGTIKASVGFNGNYDVFKISMGSTLGRDDLTVTSDGKIGINTLPTNHRMTILHNSNGNESAHLNLVETGSNDYARLRFENSGQNGLWTIAARATAGDALMNFFYNNGTDFANILSIDGDLSRVGIHSTSPEAYLHVKQKDPGISAIILENDDATGGEKWGMQIGNTNLDFLFEGVIRGSFSSATGAYTAFPPPPIALNGKPMTDKVLDQVMQIQPVSLSTVRSASASIMLDPEQIAKINPQWIVQAEDGQKGINYQEFIILSILSLQEQQDLINKKETEIQEWEKAENNLEQQLKELEATVKMIQKGEKSR